MSDTLKKWLIFFSVTALCAGLVMALYSMEPPAEVVVKQGGAAKPVTVVTVTPREEAARIKVFGEAFPLWETQLKSQVEGPIVYINPALQPGQVFKAGDLLLRVEDAPYRAALAQARRELADARVNALTLQRRGDQARADWERADMKGDPVSPLVFFEPQIRAAQARVGAAQAAVEKAEKDLAHTRVTAPYTGLVIQRSVSRGDVVFSGNALVRLVSCDEMEVRIQLDGRQTRSLGGRLGGGVEIVNSETGGQWTGALVRRGGALNRKTRLQPFYIRPEQPGLLPGMFVTVYLEGEPQANLLELPESALTRDGYVWYVDGENRLVSMTARVAFYRNGRVFVENTSGENSLRVVTMPVQSFTAGVTVAPKAGEAVAGTPSVNAHSEKVEG